MYYEVHGISDCPSCLQSQALLMANDLEYVFINSDFSKTYRNAIRQELSWQTFPIIVLVTEQKRELIGGHEQLTEHLNG